MELFLDTALIDEIQKGLEWGIIDGVTTNPTLVAQTGKRFEEVVKEIIATVPGDVSVEVVSTDAEGMVEEAKNIAAWGENVVVKIPMIPEGLKAIRELKDLGIPTNATLVFSANQVLLATKAGARYVSPFIGRLDDIGHDGMQLVRDSVQILREYNYTHRTKVITASVRHPLHVVEAAKAGSDVATVPFSVLEKMMKHPLTDIGLERFLKDWEKVPK